MKQSQRDSSPPSADQNDRRKAQDSRRLTMTKKEEVIRRFENNFGVLEEYFRE
jgi:hypothetical protein